MVKSYSYCILRSPLGSEEYTIRVELKKERKNQMIVEKNSQLITKSQTIVIKGIAILLVVLCHVGGTFTRIMTPLGGIGVSLFLIVSAYGLEKSYLKKGLHAYWRKRVVTVFLPYALCEGIALLAGAYKISFLDFLLDVTLLKPLFTLGWYLNYLLLWYIVFWIIHKISYLNKYRVFSFGLVAITFLIYFNFNSPIRFEQSFAFFLGIVLANYDEILYRTVAKLDKRSVKKYETVCKLYCVVFLLVAIGLLGIKQLSIVRQGFPQCMKVLDLFIKFFASTGILGSVLMLEKYWGIFKCTKICYSSIYRLGNVAFELYLIHGYFLFILDLNLNYFLCLLLFMMFSLGGTVILYGINITIKNYIKINFV